MKPALIAFLVTITCGTILPAAASAAMLGTISHDYGSGAGKINPGGNDPLFADYVAVSDRSSQRFADSFDFSGLEYSRIDFFELRLRFSRSANGFIPFLGREDWRVRAGESWDLLDMNRVGPWTMQTFMIDGAIDTFDAMVAAGTFDLRFAELSLRRHRFRLDEAVLGIHGAPVPIPGAVWLLGSGLLALIGIRRTKF